MTLLVLPWLLMLAVSLASSSPQRVVNGDLATPHSYPWQLSLRRGSHHTCGAFLVAPGFAVTAAHCVNPKEPQWYKVVCGASNIKDTTEKSQQVIEVETVFRVGGFSVQKHPDFSGTSYTPSFPNDITVLKLKTNTTLNDYCQLANMPSPDDDYADVPGTITGWGRLYGSGPLPSVLREADITILPHDQCHSYFGNGVDSRFHICVLDKEDSSQGACNGDSGGPAQTKNKTVVGVSSFVSWGCSTTHPSVYVRVSSYLDWIQGIIDSN